tara:strand:+ start:576 stop:869 length:294 start_codon:yes stop_codon:yes gene_type:complete
MTVVWSTEAKESLAKIYFYILKASPQNAELVLDKIIALAESLQDSRFEFTIDPIINKDKFRHKSIWSYKIIYERKQDTVLIIDIFNGKQSPERLTKY